tara:strand:+ start:4867 stop:5115 length:249 start_codon:yes stop_codon:yes gene_type:complete
MNIEIYGKDNCPYCDMAVNISQQFIQESEHKYEYFKLDRDFTREELFEKFPGARTFPQVMIDGHSIGGYTELKEHIEGRRSV